MGLPGVNGGRIREPRSSVGEDVLDPPTSATDEPGVIAARATS